MLAAAVVTSGLALVAACQQSEPNSAGKAPAAKAAAAAIAAPPAPSNKPAPASTDSASGSAIDREPTLELALPSAVVVGKSGELTFTISEAKVEPRNPESVRLILQVRMHNKQRQPANFADESFRLLTKNSEIPANGGLAETVDANTDSSQASVQFVVLRGSVPHALRIESGGETAELPLVIKW